MLASVFTAQHLDGVIAVNVNSFVCRCRRCSHNQNSQSCCLQNFWRQAHNLQELLLTQFSRHRPKDTRAYRLTSFVVRHRGCLVEAFIRTITPAMLLAGTHDHCFDDGALLGLAFGRCFLNTGRDYVPKPRPQTGRSAQRQDHLQLARAAVIGNLEHASHHYGHKSFSVLLLLHRNFRHQRGLAYNLFQSPALQLGERSRLFQTDYVADVGFVLLVVRVELLRLRDHPRIERMRSLTDDLHYDGLVHAVRDHITDHFFALSRYLGFRHYFFSPAAARSRATVFTRSMSLRRPRSFFRLSVCPIFNWNLSLKSSSFISCS